MIYQKIISRFILAIPIIASLLWHYSNFGIPTADAIGWLMASSNIVSQLTVHNDFFSFLWELISHRSWRPVIFHLFVVPYFLITDGNIIWTVGLVHATFISLSIFFLYSIFRLFSGRINSALATSIIAMTQHVQFGGIEIPLFAEIALISFSLGSIYFLLRSNFFTEKKYSVLFSIFLFLALATRPVEAIFTIVIPFLIFLFYAIQKNKINIYYLLRVIKIPFITISILFLSRLVSSKKIVNIDPDSSYEIYLFSSLIIFSITVFIIFLDFFLKKDELILNDNHLKKVFIISSALFFLWWFPYFSNLYEWIYRTSFGDIVSHYEVNRDYFGKIIGILKTTGPVSAGLIIVVSIFTVVMNLIKSRSFFPSYLSRDLKEKMVESYVVLIPSILIPLALFLFTIQSTTDRKISMAVVAFFILIFIPFISNKGLPYLKNLILIPLLSAQLFAASEIINSGQRVSHFLDATRTQFVTYVLGTLYPYPVNIKPNPHFVVIENLERIATKHNLKNIATTISELSIPVDPFQLSLLAMQKNFSTSFPYTRSYDKNNFDFINQYDSLFLINPLGKMEDSKNQQALLHRIQKFGLLETGIMKRPPSNNHKYLFLLQYHYSKDELVSLGWEKIECFDINNEFSGCVFRNSKI